MSWAGEVIADAGGKWTGNAIRLATREEADAYIADLGRRWMAVRGWRTVESADPVNYRWNKDKQLLEAVDAPQE